MSKFVVVKEAPKDLNKGEYVIDTPSFLPQINLHKTKKPRNGMTGSHYIRMIIDSIAQAYDPDNMTAYSVKAHNYEGRKFNSDEEMNAIVLQMLQADYPSVFAKYLDTKIKLRPSGTSLVYYVDSGIQGQLEIFYKNGLSEDIAIKGKTFKVNENGNSRLASNEEVDAINSMKTVSKTTHTTKY